MRGKIASLCSRTHSWIFPSGGIPFLLKMCHPNTPKKTQQVLSTPAGSEGLSIPAGCPNHEHRLGLVSFSSSLFIPLSSPRLKSELHSPIGHVAWSCDCGAKTQNFKYVPAGFICLQLREERRREPVSSRSKGMLLYRCSNIIHRKR